MILGSYFIKTEIISPQVGVKEVIEYFICIITPKYILPFLIAKLGSKISYRVILKFYSTEEFCTFWCDWYIEQSKVLPIVIWKTTGARLYSITSSVINKYVVD